MSTLISPKVLLQRKIISDIAKRHYPKIPSHDLQTTPLKEVVFKKVPSETEADSEILDSEGHRVRLNSHPQNPWRP